MLLAGLGLWSCNNDDIDIPDAVDTGTNTPAAAEQMTFKATMGQSLSKSTVSRSTGETKFSSTDRLKVFNLNGDGSKFSLAGISETGTEAEFAGQIVKSDGYYAMLPYQENATIQGNTISLNLPDVQESEYEDLMVSYTTNTDGAFNFRHVGAMIRFNTFKQYKAITLMTTDDSPIAGDIQVTVSSDNSTPVVTGGTSSSIKVEHDMDVTDSVLVTLMPRVFEAGILKIGFTKTDGSTFWHTIDKKLDLRSGVMYSYSNVGQYTVTCYKDNTKSEILFSVYAADYDNKHILTAPECPLTPPQGQLYAYSLRASSTTADYYPNEIMQITNNVEIYPILQKGVSITIYNNGNDAEPQKLLVYSGIAIELPEISLKSSDGSVYGYSTNQNSQTIEYQPKTIQTFTSDITLYAVKQTVFTFNVYGNGADNPPTYTSYITDKNRSIETLPQLETRPGYFGGYNTVSNKNEINYLPGETIQISNFSGDEINFYAVYVEDVEITGTNTISLAGTVHGNTDLSSGSTKLDPPVTLEKGQKNVFTFINHCATTGTSYSDISKNVSIYLLGTNSVNSQKYKRLYLDQQHESHGTATYDLQTKSSEYMANLNGAEVTVSISHRGGLADVEIKWTGSQDGKQNTVTYKDILTWDNLYVSFIINKSYIEFK